MDRRDRRVAMWVEMKFTLGVINSRAIMTMIIISLGIQKLVAHRSLRLMEALKPRETIQIFFVYPVNY